MHTYIPAYLCTHTSRASRDIAPLELERSICFIKIAMNKIQSPFRASPKSCTLGYQISGGGGGGVLITPEDGWVRKSDLIGIKQRNVLEGKIISKLFTCRGHHTYSPPYPYPPYPYPPSPPPSTPTLVSIKYIKLQYWCKMNKTQN